MYEYHVLVGDAPANAGQLNEVGREGWELVAVLTWDRQTFFYFKRPLAVVN